MSKDHDHSAAAGGNERSLWIAFTLTFGFLIAEVIGGIATNSLALISDAAHMFTDAAELGLSRNPPCDVQVPGHRRLGSRARVPDLHLDPGLHVAEGSSCSEKSRAACEEVQEEATVGR